MAGAFWTNQGIQFSYQHLSPLTALSCAYIEVTWKHKIDKESTYSAKYAFLFMGLHIYIHIWAGCILNVMNGFYHHSWSLMQFCNSWSCDQPCWSQPYTCCKCTCCTATGLGHEDRTLFFSHLSTILLFYDLAIWSEDANLSIIPFSDFKLSVLSYIGYTSHSSYLFLTLKHFLSLKSVFYGCASFIYFKIVM